MAKLKTYPIGESDLIEFLESSSDFAFEQEIFKTLIDLDFKAQHSGTYSDPNTGLPREFDIRGTKWLSISHIEFCTKTGLTDYLRALEEFPEDRLLCEGT